jgi:HD-GYP domain-containing protein (c-di-GMP phosphodiesterase class II)
VLAAQMHDVGKISVPDSILRKPSALTPEEFEIVKEHTVRGHAIAQQVAALSPLADVIRSHHERLDGSGYPNGLSGDEIPLLARIIAVADTYDALTSKRPYREAWSHVEAMAEIMRVRGETLDPACVDALVTELASAGARETLQRAAA